MTFQIPFQISVSKGVRTLFRFPVLAVFFFAPVLVLSGCASRSSSVAPVAVPSANYKGLSCDEAKLAHSQKMDEMHALSKQQNTAAVVDAIGVFLILVPVGTLFGADNEGKLAQAKGEVMALEGAVSINCQEDKK